MTFAYPWQATLFLEPAILQIDETERLKKLLIWTIYTYIFIFLQSKSSPTRPVRIEQILVFTILIPTLMMLWLNPWLNVNPQQLKACLLQLLKISLQDLVANKNYG